MASEQYRKLVVTCYCLHQINWQNMKTEQTPTNPPPHSSVTIVATLPTWQHCSEGVTAIPCPQSAVAKSTELEEAVLRIQYV
jgi:hypothetical protein